MALSRQAALSLSISLTMAVLDEPSVLPSPSPAVLQASIVQLLQLLQQLGEDGELPGILWWRGHRLALHDGGADQRRASRPDILPAEPLQVGDVLPQGRPGIPGCQESRADHLMARGRPQALEEAGEPSCYLSLGRHCPRCQQRQEVVVGGSWNIVGEEDVEPPDSVELAGLRTLEVPASQAPVV